MGTTTQRMKSILMMNLVGMCTSIGTMRPTPKISKKILTRSRKTDIGKMEGKAKLRFWHWLWKISSGIDGIARPDLSTYPTLM